MDSVWIPFTQLRNKKVNYLEHLASVALSHNMILAHIPALSACTCGREEVSAGFHRLVGAWVKGHKV